jgi:hypothetical protein
LIGKLAFNDGDAKNAASSDEIAKLSQLIDTQREKQEMMEQQMEKQNNALDKQNDTLSKICDFLMNNRNAI